MVEVADPTPEERFEKLPRVNTTYEDAHHVIKGDPRIDGPYLDEVREREAEDLRRWRNQRSKDVTLDENDTAADQKAADVKAQAEKSAKAAKRLAQNKKVAESNAPAAKKSAPAKKAPAKKTANK